MNKMVKTRIAPSPTGEYHVGSLRTSLYNYAFAKNNNGQFVLRIEDTDRNRLVEGATERIKQTVSEFGFKWDEYFEQSQRLDIYPKYAHQLVEQGHAYYCFCTPEQLEKDKQEQQANGSPNTFYVKRCRDIDVVEAKKRVDTGEKYVVRLKIPENEIISFHDEVLGDVSFESNSIDDQVLLKSDGWPTYHLAVVVDDHLMDITHIMRGIEWLPSTPKHVLLYRYFGWEFPKHAHLPNLKEIGSNKKMSKRFGDVHVLSFLESGYLVEALLNFIMFLGWNPGTEKEIYSLDEFIKDFSLERVGKTDLVAFDREKLLWMNGQYIRSFSDEELWDRIKIWSKRFSVNLTISILPEDMILSIVRLVKDRLKTFSEFESLTKYFVTKPAQPNFSEFSDRPKEILDGFMNLYKNVENWSIESLDKVSHDFISEKGYKPKEAFMTLRIAITGEKATPPIFDILNFLGKEETLNRLTA